MTLMFILPIISICLIGYVFFHDYKRKKTAKEKIKQFDRDKIRNGEHFPR